MPDESASHCYERADACYQKAMRQADPSRLDVYFFLESRWRLLAQAHELIERRLCAVEELRLEPTD
jgi:hypothetical protein